MNLTNKIFFFLLAVLLSLPAYAQVIVYPGDASNNGIVDNVDLLLIGNSFGKTGPARNDNGTVFDSIVANSWQTSNNLGLNDAYVDCDGNGIVNANDVDIVELHYGGSHGAQNVDSLPQGMSTAIPDLFLVTSNDSITPGSGFMLDFVLGTSAEPAVAVYGLAFTLRFDTAMIQEDSLEIFFNNSFLNQNNQTISISKVYTGTGNLGGRVDIAISKIDQQLATGFGSIGTLGIVMEENVSGKTTFDLDFEIENIYLVNPDLELLPVNPINWTGEVYVNTTKDFGDLPVKIFPNPVQDELMIDVFDLRMNNINLYNTLGQIKLRQQLSGQSEFEWFLGDLPGGFYFLTIETNKGIISRKILVK